tara:strand:+ start:686 stop:832 length:147 start_codon:yes stop_codon:yes gene_type:complete
MNKRELPALAGSDDNKVTPLFIKSKFEELDLGIKNLNKESNDSNKLKF